MSQETPGSAQATVARNAFYLVIGQVTTTTLAIVLSAALGRWLGAENFGLYFLISSFSTFAYVLVDWGQQPYVIREVARSPERGSELLGTALLLRAVGAALASLPIGVVAWALGYDARTCWFSVAYIAVSLPFFLAQSYGMVFRGRDRMELEAGVSAANKAAVLAFAVAALVLGVGLPGVIVAHALAGLLALALAARLYRHVTTGPLRYSATTARQVIVGGSPLFAMMAASSVQPYLDALILSKLAPADAVGWFGAAKNIMGTLLAPALILGAAAFPRLSRAASNLPAFKAEVRTGLRPIIWLGALAGMGTYLFADAAIGIVYGQRHFEPSGMILKVFAPGFFLLFIDVLLGYALTALGRAAALSIAKVGSVVVSTALNLVLIPIFQQRYGNGGIGVVVSFVASELVVFSGALLLLPRKSLGPGVAVDVARALGSVVITALLFKWLPPLPFVVSVTICVLSFALCSIALGLVRRDDVQLFRALLRKGQRSATHSALEQKSERTSVG
jgi:PST family polysaccharide transporter